MLIMICQQVVVDTNQNDWYLLKPFLTMVVLEVRGSNFLTHIPRLLFHLGVGTKKSGV